MTEKRYFKREWEEEYYIFDSETISEKEFDEKVEYEDYQAFADSIQGDEVCKLLNELHEQIQALKLELELSKPLFSRRELERKLKEQHEENEQLKQQRIDLLRLIDNNIEIYENINTNVEFHKGEIQGKLTLLYNLRELILK